MDPGMIPEIFRLYDCVIVESFGVGGIPQRLMDAFAEGLGDYDKTHKVLILTTQVTYEGSDVGIYEVGKRVKNRFRFLEAHDMTIEAVVTKIMWLLAQDCDSFDQLQQRFYRQVNFDTFYNDKPYVCCIGCTTAISFFKGFNVRKTFRCIYRL
mgnify:CR=1 FL=1